MRREEALFVLGLTEATIGQLDIAYKRYVNRNHPDRDGGSHEMMVKGNEARAVLKAKVTAATGWTRPETYFDVDAAIRGVKIKTLSKEELLYWVTRYKASFGYDRSKGRYDHLESAYNHYDEIKGMPVTLANYMRMRNIRGAYFLWSEDWRVVMVNTKLDTDGTKKSYVDVIEDGVTYRVTRATKKLFAQHREKSAVDKVLLVRYTLQIESTTKEEPNMNTNTFHNTSINDQPTLLDQLYKAVYTEMHCMTQYKAKQDAVKAMLITTPEMMLATYQQAVKAMVAKKSIFSNSTLKLTEEQLLKVKGVGSVKAKAIMEFINSYAVTKIEQLAHVKGVGAVLLNTLVNHKF